MYEELLNFLLARKKRLLSEEETDRLMELIAQSMDMEEDYRERTDSTALIRRILDNVDVEEIVESSDGMRNAIDDLFFEEDYGSESMESDMVALYCEEPAEPLSRQKFVRGLFGKGTAKGEDAKSAPSFSLPGVESRGSAFCLPEEREEFPFDLGELKDVRSSGPEDCEFVDEEGRRI